MYLPTLAVQVGNQFWFQGEVVGQKYQSFASVVLDHHAEKRYRVVLARKIGCEHSGLITQHHRNDPIYQMRVAPLEFGVALGPRHKESFGFMNDEQSFEIQIAPVHQIEGPWLQHKIVHDIDLVGFAVGDVNEAGDVASQVQQRVQLDGRLGRSKRRPCKHRQAQVYGAGVECVDRRIELHSKRLRGVQRSCHTNQVLREGGIDLPRACGVRIGQRIARNRLATKPHVIQPPSLRTQIDFDVAQRLSVGQLSEGHGEELIQAREVFDLVLPIVIGYTAAKRTQRQIQHELRKNELALVHGGYGRKSAKNPKSDFRRSNRDQTETPNSSSESLTYDVPM